MDTRTQTRIRYICTWVMLVVTLSGAAVRPAHAASPCRPAAALDPCTIYEWLKTAGAFVMLLGLVTFGIGLFAPQEILQAIGIQQSQGYLFKAAVGAMVIGAAPLIVGLLLEKDTC